MTLSFAPARRAVLPAALLLGLAGPAAADDTEADTLSVLPTVGSALLAADGEYRLVGSMEAPLVLPGLPGDRALSGFGTRMRFSVPLTEESRDSALLDPHDRFAAGFKGSWWIGYDSGRDWARRLHGDAWALDRGVPAPVGLCEAAVAAAQDSARPAGGGLDWLARSEEVARPLRDGDTAGAMSRLGALEEAFASGELPDLSRGELGARVRVAHALAQGRALEAANFAEGGRGGAPLPEVARLLEAGDSEGAAAWVAKLGLADCASADSLPWGAMTAADLAFALTHIRRWGDEADSPARGRVKALALRPLAESLCPLVEADAAPDCGTARGRAAALALDAPKPGKNAAWAAGKAEAAADAALLRLAAARPDEVLGAVLDLLDLLAPETALCVRSGDPGCTPSDVHGWWDARRRAHEEAERAWREAEAEYQAASAELGDAERAFLRVVAGGVLAGARSSADPAPDAELAALRARVAELDGLIAGASRRAAKKVLEEQRADLQKQLEAAEAAAAATAEEKKAEDAPEVAWDEATAVLEDRRWVGAAYGEARRARQASSERHERIRGAWKRYRKTASRAAGTPLGWWGRTLRGVLPDRRLAPGVHGWAGLRLSGAYDRLEAFVGGLHDRSVRRGLHIYSLEAGLDAGLAIGPKVFSIRAGVTRDRMPETEAAALCRANDTGYALGEEVPSTDAACTEVLLVPEWPEPATTGFVRFATTTVFGGPLPDKGRLGHVAVAPGFELRGGFEGLGGERETFDARVSSFLVFTAGPMQAQLGAGLRTSHALGACEAGATAGCGFELLDLAPFLYVGGALVPGGGRH